MSKGRDLLRLLQLNGGTFPTGGFSQSWGLETYVEEGRIRDRKSFEVFLRTYLRSSVALCEGPVICRAYELWESLKRNGSAGEIRAGLKELEELSNAIKVTAESRDGSLRMGRAFTRITASLIDAEDMRLLQEIFGMRAGSPAEIDSSNEDASTPEDAPANGDAPGTGDDLRRGPVPEISYPVAYGCVCSILDIVLEDVVMAYIFGAANTLTQSALKLIPLGNIDAQQALYDAQDLIEDCCCLCMKTPLDEVTNFCPGIDIASLRHEELPVRLYMS